MIELLSPAGDKERMYYAFLYGADAVYLGGRNFGLRANATNFTEEELKECVTYAHSISKKVYVTVNIVFHNEDINGLKEYLKFLESIKVDAIIVSDPLVCEVLKENGIDLEVHLSTQASTLNSRAAKFNLDLGISRIVLAREASKSDIARIKKDTNAELECFIQGAMCTSMSGRCVLSNYATNRDSNRGGCAQVCRWIFKDEKDRDFSMMPKDLNMTRNIKEMIRIGVNSFKIEGRMRSIYYIATVLSTYRKIIDKIVSNTLTDEYIIYAENIINRVANRESVPQFFDRVPGLNEQYFNGRQEESNQDFLGLVKNIENGSLILEVRNYFKKGMIVQVFGPSMKTIEFTLDSITDMDDNPIEFCNHPKDIVKIRCPYECEINAMMRTKVFDILEEI
ncbi:MAG TPA: collagenase-like protease [Firmicutes bacterium]|nr:collagenase-like protease [Bacillota bacterium]